MKSTKTAFIIQARMQSARLPGKVMKPLPLVDGKPLLSWIIDGLRSVDLPQKEIVVATSTHPSNDQIENFCRSKKISCYRGAEADVLSRFQEITRNGGYQTVLRFTADNPFLDREIIKNTIAYHRDGDYDYTSSSGTPLGMIVEVVKSDVLLGLKPSELSEDDKEHVTLHIRRRDKFKKGLFKTGLPEHFKDLRLTVDYPSDFLLASTICDFSRKHDGLQGVELIEEIWKTYPWIFKANQDNRQKRQFESLEDEINYAGQVLNHLDLNRAADQLKK